MNKYDWCPNRKALEPKDILNVKDGIFCCTGHPPAFSCHKTEEHVREAKLSYEGCRWPKILLRVQEGKKIRECSSVKRFFWGMQVGKQIFRDFMWAKKVFGRFRWVGKIIASTQNLHVHFCSVENPGMDINSGIFTVSQPGVYQVFKTSAKFCHSILKKLPMPSNFCL